VVECLTERARLLLGAVACQAVVDDLRTRQVEADRDVVRAGRQLDARWCGRRTGQGRSGRPAWLYERSSVADDLGLVASGAATREQHDPSDPHRSATRCKA